MSRKLFAIVVGFAFLAPVVASAHFSECTPGFWKNRGFDFDGPHSPLVCEEGVPLDLPRCPAVLAEILGIDEADAIAHGANPQCCAGAYPYTCGELETMLGTGGACPNGECDREEARAFLNSCFINDVINGEDLNPCPD